MTIYIDMDGVLAKYERAAYIGENPMYLQKGLHYFRDLKPDEKMIKVLTLLDSKIDNCELNAKLKILTSVPNNSELYMEHIQDKIHWIKTYCPLIDTDTQFIAAVSSKRDLIQDLKKNNLSKKDILIDDFNRNLNEWQSSGGTSVKYLNGINSPNTFDGLNLEQTMSAEKIVETIILLTKTIMTN